jgi:hypothetical protein
MQRGVAGCTSNDFMLVEDILQGGQQRYQHGMQALCCQGIL